VALLLPADGVVGSLLVVETRMLSLDGCEALFDGLVKQVTKHLKPVHYEQLQPSTLHSILHETVNNDINDRCYLLPSHPSTVFKGQLRGAYLSLEEVNVSAELCYTVQWH
jgi:hypothetical protein